LQPIISPNVRIRHPEHFIAAHGVIVDDYCYFSTRVSIKRWSHIASGCSVAGGIDRTFALGEFSSLSSGVKIWCTSDDFVNDVVTILPPGCPAVKSRLIQGDVVLGDYTAVGANAVVMPDNVVPEGVTIGSLSFVPPRFKFEPWSVYAGSPIRYLKPRNEKSVREQVARIERFLAEATSIS